MIKKEKIKNINYISEKIKLIDSKINYKLLYKKNNIFSLLAYKLIIKNKLILIKYFILFFFFYFFINYKNIFNIFNYLKGDILNKYLYINESLEKDYNKNLINENLINNKKLNISLIQKETYNEIIKKKIITFLNFNTTKNFNN